MITKIFGGLSLVLLIATASLGVVTKNALGTVGAQEQQIETLTAAFEAAVKEMKKGDEAVIEAERDKRRLRDETEALRKKLADAGQGDECIGVRPPNDVIDLMRPQPTDSELSNPFGVDGADTAPAL